MPKIVDHDEQRAKFAEAAMSLIAREGLDGVTMRAVAAEAGLSYGSLFHYFDSKDELLGHAVRHSMALQSERVNRFVDSCQGLEALEALLCDDAILDSSSRDSWVVWLTFLYKAALQESFAELHDELVEGWLTRIESLLRAAQERQEIRQDLDISTEALGLWAFSAGLGQLALLDAAALPTARQRALITSYLDKLKI